MCRMLGVVGRIDREIVGGFRKLAHRGKIKPKSPGKDSPVKDDYRHHVDGWGVGFFRDGDPRILKEGTDAFYSYGYEIVTREMLTYPPEMALFHVRRATDKTTVSDAKAHPFGGSLFNRDFIFGHNGSIDGYDPAKHNGMIDSEYFFDLLLDNMKATDFDAVWNGTQTTRKQILDRFNGYQSLTYILTDGKALYAYRDSTADEDYYQLFWSQNGVNSMVCSEELDKRQKWTMVENGQMLRITKDGIEKRS